MAPNRRKGAAAAKSAARAARSKWKVGDLVLAKVKGFPAWPALVSEPEDWGQLADWKKVFVYFFGTRQIGFCNPADVEPFTEEKKHSLVVKKHQGRSADFVRAVREIVDVYEKLKKHQVDEINSIEETNTGDGGQLANTSSHVGSKDREEASGATIDSKLKSSSSSTVENEDGPTATQAPALSDKPIISEQPTDKPGTKETSKLTTYSSRKKRRLGSKDCVTERNAPPARKPRSSRVESRKFQSSLTSCSDSDKSAEEVSGNGTRDGCLRRTKRVRKSPYALEWDDGASAPFDLNGSEILTGDSDTLSFNESTIDSGCKHGNLETVLECLEGDAELSKGLDFQIKAVVIKKKRTHNRKRVIIDATEPESLMKSDSCSEAGRLSISQNSESGCKNIDERFSKDDGDKHLPLVKRARVRISSLEEEHNAASKNEEKPMNGSINATQQINSSLNCEGDGSANRDSFSVKGAADNVSPSNGTQILDNKLRPWKFMKSQSFGSSADDEAVLPPSKRLHRALEAMSVHATEESQTFGVEASSTMKTTINVSCALPEKKFSNMTMGIQIAEEGQACVSGNCSSPNPEVEESTKVSVEAVIHDISMESSKSQSDELFKDVFVKPHYGDIDEDHHKSCFGADAIQSVIQIKSHDLHKQEVSPRSNSDSFGNLLVLKDEVRPESAELRTFSGKTLDKELGTSENVEIIPNPVSESLKTTEVSPEEGKHVLQYAAEGACSEKTNSVTCPIVNNSQDNVMCEEIADIVKEIPRNTSDLHSGERDESGRHSSPPCSMHVVDSPAHDSSPNSFVCHVSTSESANFLKNDGFPSPNSRLQREYYSRALVGEGKTDSSVIHTPKSFGKRSNYAETHAVLSSFETVLGSLTRTKESIGRATRIAIDCAKFGASAKVVEILLRNLEIESNLHRRVDLFFLVDSITRRSGGLKGNVGAYPSVIQRVLPRLLSAVAPPGNIGHENRRQCLKVLRLWLERRILPESFIRQHMRELDSLNALSSRRSERTERPMDDPVREMEGMLVDEYGSNSSFQLSGFCMPCMLKHEDEGSDSDGKSFEAVTPEHNRQTAEESEVATGIEKHRHILEDVDGELEMEDVAPSCDTKINSTSRVSGENALQRSHDPQHSLPPVPPLPQDVPPPLPSSPPPQPPPAPGAVAGPHSNGADSKTYNMEGDLRQSLPRQSKFSSPPMSSNAVHYRASECREPQMPMHSNSSRSFNNFSRHPNNFHQTDGRNFHKKTYPPRPPHYPPPSNQCSYVKNQRDDFSPPYNHRYHSASNADRDYYYSHDRTRPPPYEHRENWRFHASSYSGPRYHDRMKGSYGGGSYDHPRCDPERMANQGWSYHRETNHRDSWNFRQPPEGPPVGMRDPDFWQTR